MQSVIVYRNPLEAMIWESMMNGGALVFIIVMGIALLGVATYAGIERLHHNAYRKWRYSQRPYGFVATLYIHNGKISIAVSVLAALALHLWYLH